MSTADLEEVLDHLSDLLADARALPMSASCVVNRGEALDLVDEARRVVPGELDRARQLLAERDALLEQAREQAERTVEQARAEAERTLEQAREQAERLVAEAQQEQDRLVEQTAVFARAQADADRLLGETAAEADRVLDQAHADAEAMRLQTEDYVDGKLAGFEQLLATTLAAVQRGRDRLAGDPGAPSEDGAGARPQGVPDEHGARPLSRHP